MEQSPWEANIHSDSQEIPAFYGALPSSQEPSAGPYPEADEPSLHLRTLFP